MPEECRGREGRACRSGAERGGVSAGLAAGDACDRLAFFDQVFASVGEEYRDCCLLLGDSLTSDMQGGRNAGIPTCFYGKKEAADDRCDFVIEDLLELLPLLEEGS